MAIAHKGEIRCLLASIRRAADNNQKLILFPKQKHRYTPILELLHKDGFIQSFEERESFLVIRLKQTYWKTWGQPVKALSYISSITRTARKRNALRRKDLSRLQMLQGTAVCFISSTDRGIINSHHATKKIVGGIPLVKVY